ncbi:MAG: hypothetical protein RLO12_08425 [Fulvivirga sp.]
MKLTYYFALAAILLFTACSDDDAPQVTENGTFQLEFDHFVGSTPMSLIDAGSEDYMFETASGEAFNITTFRYYISKIKLEGPNGELFEDVMNVSPNADEVKGFYLVNQADASSRHIDLSDVPAGTYNKVTFTVGIGEEGIEEGAAGGILDPAEGAWFWNWNAGYIGFAIEGGAQNSPQEQIEGEGWIVYENSFALHVGGWKDVAPAEGETQKFVNNLREVTLNFDSKIRVGEGLDPNAHIVVDILKVLDGATIDFSQTFAVHSPKPGQPFAEKIPEAFILDHTHQ